MTASETSKLIAAKRLCAFGFFFGSIPSQIGINASEPGNTTVMPVNNIICISESPFFKLFSIVDNILSSLLHDSIIITP